MDTRSMTMQAPKGRTLQVTFTGGGSGENFLRRPVSPVSPLSAQLRPLLRQVLDESLPAALISSL